MILQKIKALWVSFQFLLTVSFVIIFMYLFHSKNRQVRQIWAKSQRFLAGYTLEYEGEISLKAKLIILNHQSLFDIVALEDLHPANLCWIGKKEITNTPFYGHIMKAPPMITIDREDKKSLIKLLKDVKQRIAENRVVPIFPEGTRSDGKKLLKFKSGAKFLAEKLDLIVQPAVIVGSNDVFDSKHFRSKFGHIKIIFLPEIDPKQNETWFEDMKINMQKVLDDELAKYSGNR